MNSRCVQAYALYGVILLASLWVLLRGHNEPGGGFIGGLMAVSASILWAVAHGSAAATHCLSLRDPVRLAAVGVLLAAISGLPALGFDQAFLTHWWGALPLGFTELKVSTVLGLAVLGAAANLVLLAAGRLGSALPAVVPLGEKVLGESGNPLPQALVLTAIVIGFALVC